jgi:hypothetical protein
MKAIYFLLMTLLVLQVQPERGGVERRTRKTLPRLLIGDRPWLCLRRGGRWRGGGAAFREA